MYPLILYEYPNFADAKQEYKLQHMNMKRKTIYLLLAASLVSCNEMQRQELPEYPVLTVATGSATIEESYSASIQGRQDIEIYPQISGKITRVCVKEGEKVHEGKVLFVIDQIPYKAALSTADALVHVAEAQVETARLDYESKQALFKEEVISEYDLAQAKNALAVAKANLEQARAGQINARNDLSYTEVKSPTDGVVGTLPYRAGSLVSPSIPQPLTTVSDNKQMFVYFSMTENQLRALIRRHGSPAETIRQMPSVRLRLNDESIYDRQGCIETISGIINPKTGTASVRSVFPNDKQLLFSGSVGNVILSHPENDVVIIPQTATYEIQDKIFVYKVIDGTATSTEIDVERLNDGKEYIVRNGLVAGDVIVSEGVGLIKDGQSIAIKEKKQ